MHFGKVKQMFPLTAQCLLWKANAPSDIYHACLTKDELSVKTPQFPFVHLPVTRTATTSGNTQMYRKSIIFPQVQNLSAATANTSVKCSVWRGLVCSGVPEDSGLMLMKDTWAYMSETWFDTRSKARKCDEMAQQVVMPKRRELLVQTCMMTGKITTKHNRSYLLQR